MTKQHLTQHKDRLVALPPYPYTITTAIKDRLVALPPCPTLPASVFINHPEVRLQPHRGSLAAHTFIGNNKGVGVRVDSQYYHEWWAFSHCMYIRGRDIILTFDKIGENGSTCIIAWWNVIENNPWLMKFPPTYSQVLDNYAHQLT